MTQDEIQLHANDVVAELSERGRVEWELAQAKAMNRKLAAMVTELRSEEKPAPKLVG